MRVAVIDNIHPVLAEELTRAGHQCTAMFHLEQQELIGALQNMEGVIVRSKLLKHDVLRELKDLRFIGRVGAGMENIDRAYCEKNDISLFNSPEGNRDGVGEMCVLQCLMLMKHVMRADAQVRRGLWLREENRGSDLQGKTVGIIGFGNMGSSFAAKLKGFDVKILAHDTLKKGFGSDDVEESELDRIFNESDVISLHLPLNNETRQYADRNFFDQIEKPVYFLNTSRGAIVDTEALIDAIDNGKVIGAGLDVLEFERPDLCGLDPTMKPAIQERLFSHERILLTPHIAGVTHEGARKMAAVLARKIIDAFPQEKVGTSS
ncbi:MAG: phosphoglycerate dehydrogenase [Bacteroidota bacterium]|nr:phosphoglycerate dehydrogenase [Bacteroidota bacterium]